MNNFKNLWIAILIGLLGLSLFTLPAQGAKEPASNPIKNTQYESCLSMSQLGGMNQLYFNEEFPLSDIQLYLTKAFFHCSPFKPLNAKDAKSIQYKECLKFGPTLFNILKFTPIESPDTTVFYGWTFEQVREVVSKSHDTCKSYLPKWLSGNFKSLG